MPVQFAGTPDYKRDPELVAISKLGLSCFQLQHRESAAKDIVNRKWSGADHDRSAPFGQQHLH
jgi:hypothetical protein